MLWLSIAAGTLVVFAVACAGEETDPTPAQRTVEPAQTTVTLTTVPSPTLLIPTQPAEILPQPIEIPSQPADTVTISIKDHDELGAILVDGAGRTLYLLIEDERNRSNCGEGCTQTWPPLLIEGDASAGEGVTQQVLKSIRRDDGSNQVAYNGWPLYYFSGDETPGDAEGQNSGGIWFVVSIYGGPKQNNALVKVSEHPELGAILTDANNRTLYLFTVDERDKTNCLHGCAMAWPPLVTVGDSTADELIADERLDTVTRLDGSEQITYNGWPLYYYVLDERAGDIKGQNSGLNWYVVSTYGGPIQSNAVVRTDDHPELGTILTEASGRTVYLFTLDERDESLCTAGCALAWPPLLTVGSPMVEEGVAGRSLDIIRREDGYFQVTYDGQPLYYFAPDETPGDTGGQGVGDVWFVVSPEGQAVTTPPPTPSEMDHPPETPMTVVPTVEPPPTPPPVSVETPAPGVSPSPTAPPDMLEIATIEAYAASQFFPPKIIVIKDIPVTLKMTRLHKEHVNQFTIAPFVFSRPFANPGSVAKVTFTPDQSGEFKMRNVGHFFDAEFIVAESVADAKMIAAQGGMQEFSLIYDFFATVSVTPGRVVVQKDIPVKVYNLSLGGKTRVSIEPFYRPDEVNVMERKVTTFEFIPNVAGEFPISDGDGNVIGTLVVE